MTPPGPPDLTPAERAAAEALARWILAAARERAAEQAPADRAA